MRLRAKSFSFEEQNTMKETILTEDRLSIDWEEEGWDGHLEARSVDGVHYRGTYGYPVLDDWRHVEFQLYKSGDGRIALVGKWFEDGGDVGTWLILGEPE